MLMLLMSFMLFSPSAYASGDPGFTVYAFTASDTTHNLPDDLDLSKTIIFVGGLKIYEYGVELYPYDDEINDWPVVDLRLDEYATDGIFRISNWPSEENAEFNSSTHPHAPSGLLNSIGLDIVIIVSDNPDSFTAWGYQMHTEPEQGTNEAYFYDVLNNDPTRITVYSNGRLSFYNGDPGVGFIVSYGHDEYGFYFSILDDAVVTDVIGMRTDYSEVDNTFEYSNVIIIAAQPTYEPIYTIENISGNYNFNQVGKYGYIEVEGLYSFADIELLAVGNEPFILDGELQTTFTSSKPGFDITKMFIENSIIKYTHTTLGVIDLIWVTPGKLHVAGLFEDPNWGFETLNENMPVEMDYIYRVPGITGTAVFITNVDAPIAEGQIRASIVAYDETDGDITDQIIKTSDTYTPNKNTVGEWVIVYSITDSSSNTVTFTVTVFVRDVTKPTIDLGELDEITVSYLDNLNPLTYHSNFTITDNYYDLEDLVITVNVGTFDGTPKTSTITYTVTDPSGNVQTAQMVVHVIDDVAPEIFGPDEFTTTISSGLTLGTILTQYSASDEIDGTRTNYITVISNNYTANKDVAGTYYITLRVSDTSGNVAEKTIEVTVSDDVVPVFYVTRAFISVAESITLTLEDIIRILYVTGQIESMEGYTLVASTYFGNELNPGVYTLTISNGINLLSIAINVDANAPVVYAIQFNSNGGSFVSNMLINRGQTATKPLDPTRDGYTFAGWYKDALFISPMNWNQEISDDLVLYAKWVPTTAAASNGVQLAIYISGGLIVLGLAIIIKKKAR